MSPIFPQTHMNRTRHGSKDHEFIPVGTKLHEDALKAASAADIAALLSNAETALGALRSEFGSWLELESARLGQAHDDYLADNSKARKDILYRALHDMRSNGAAFGNPLAGRIADNICNVFDAAGAVPDAIVEAHVRAIRAAIRERVTSADRGVGGMVIAELTRVAGLVSTA